MLDVPNNLENPELGDRKVPFGGSSILSGRISWKSLLKSISVCSPAMRYA